MSEPTAKVQHALTPEQWEEFETAGGRAIIFNDLAVSKSRDGLGVFGAYEGGVQSAPQRHGIAALALHGQPFGFTWADVDTLAKEVGYMEAATEYQVDPEITDRLRSLVDRIAALLPPRP